MTHLRSVLSAPGALEPAKIITALSSDPYLDTLFDRGAQVSELMTVREHSSRVVAQAVRYRVPEVLDSRHWKWFILSAALHDIGKSLPSDAKDQHLFTSRILMLIRPALPVTDIEFTRMLAVCGTDVVGELFRDSTVSPFWRGPVRTELWSAAKSGTLTYPRLRDLMREVAPSMRPECNVEAETALSAQKLRSLAVLSELPVEEYFNLQMAFYQADSTSYSVESGGLPAFERLYDLPDEWVFGGKAPLFTRDIGRPRLRFSPAVQALAERLEARVTAAV